MTIATIPAAELKADDVLLAENDSTRTVVSVDIVGGTTWLAFTAGRDEPLPNDEPVRIQQRE